MTLERNDLFDLAYRFITETQESIFLTGKAGTGKTTFLKYLKENTPKNMIVAAPTGVAAINAGGVTLHSLFHLPFHPFIPSAQGKTELLSKLRYGKQKQQLLRKMDLLVIDEISMVRCDVMDAIDTILRSIRRNHQEAFGGVQIVCIGDLYQLPPVAQPQEWTLLKEYYNSPFFFDSLAIHEQQPLLIELTKIYRQKEESFVELLNKVRNNRMEAADFELLHQRLKIGFQPQPEEQYITLTTHNNQADSINQQQLQKLPAEVFVFKATVEGEFPENIYPAEFDLRLKEGAQVMFLKNDVIDKKYFNGKIGVVKQLTEKSIVVQCADGDITVKKEVWENIRYTLNQVTEKLEEEPLGRFEQYPLRLAWAVTIHKSQGLTFDKVMIDAAAAFSSGQVYVALSRCTRLDGIVLLSKIPPSAVYTNQLVTTGEQQLTPKGSLAERFNGARLLFTQQLLEEIFLMKEVSRSIKALQYRLSEHLPRFNNDAAVWVEELHQKFEQQKEVALKFLNVANELLKQQIIAEKNPALQSRITDAANYFLPKLEEWMQAVNKHPLVTEHKEAALPVDEVLIQLLQSLHKASSFLHCCRGPFSVNNFLKHKLQYAILKTQISSYASKKKTGEVNLPHADLYHRLRSWRDGICEEKNLPVYVVANGETLKELCLYLPLTSEHLLKIKGMGPVKVEKWGDMILTIINDYCEEKQIVSNTDAMIFHENKIRKPKKISSSEGTFAETLKLFREGKLIAEIADQRNLAPGTIESHLFKLVKEGHLEAAGIVDALKMQQILNVIHQTEDANTTLVKNLLGENYSFFEVRLGMYIFEQQTVKTSQRPM